MLSIGDKVVYPMHGAGIIEAIEEQEVLGERQHYYILKLSYGGMRVLIPLRNIEHVGLREVIGMPEVSRVFEVLKESPEKSTCNWNQRFHANLTKIKSGNIYEVAEVVRNLMMQNKIKKLSAGERRLLETARQILVSELVLACGKEASAVEDGLNELFTENTPIK